MYPEGRHLYPMNLKFVVPGRTKRAYLEGRIFCTWKDELVYSEGRSQATADQNYTSSNDRRGSSLA